LSVSVILDANRSQLDSDVEEMIRSTAQATVGFNKKRGDVLSLMVYPFNNDLALRAQRDMEERAKQEKNMFMIVVGLLMAIPVLLGLVYLFVRVSRARALAKEKAALEQAAREAEALRQAEAARKAKLREQQQWEWEQRFQDIKNFFPEITDMEEKKKKVQELRHKAYRFARDNDRLPPDFEELTPEEQFLYKEAFKRKAEGTLEDGLARLEAIIGEREKERQEELEKLNAQASQREELESRVRDLAQNRPEDAISVLRIWLEE
ncbi:MAG TPA: flagellar M-ring protein FliF C-terminal domain-containing protein, partial [Candidatus Ozemobacteraceae bacterium]|nr:flagellar M-ring protein FliF C-terminal domain-containing protein [Candidatus Ozemobacteraceae bacterium]